jgi:hypothetical protein
MVIYASGFFYVALLGINQRREQNAAARQGPGQAGVGLEAAAEEPSVATGSASLPVEEIL